MERRGGSLNKEVEERPWFSGTQEGEVQIKKQNRNHGLVERRGGKFKLRSRRETMV